MVSKSLELQQCLAGKDLGRPRKICQSPVSSKAFWPWSCMQIVVLSYGLLGVSSWWSPAGFLVVRWCSVGALGGRPGFPSDTGGRPGGSARRGACGPAGSGPIVLSWSGRQGRHGRGGALSLGICPGMCLFRAQSRYRRYTCPGTVPASATWL